MRGKELLKALVDHLDEEVIVAGDCKLADSMAQFSMKEKRAIESVGLFGGKVVLWVGVQPWDAEWETKK